VYWECSVNEALDYIEYRKRAASVSTGFVNPPKPRNPAIIDDSRFDKSRGQREHRCDKCEKLKVGNRAGAFRHIKNAPRAGDRKAAWERGDWDATWYCTDCYKLYYNCSYDAVFDMLGFTERAAKIACECGDRKYFYIF